ncbi:hypothetical protein GGR52DRAFT_66631 [Hypoxylon sp. FL1284]|nr:hypothetical protein GGR52DRAFT_66631 [Hypoxylon sp. FL1284]
MNLPGHQSSSHGAFLFPDESTVLPPSAANDSLFEPFFVTEEGPISDVQLRGFLYPKTLLIDYKSDAAQLETSSFYPDLLDFLQVLSTSNQLIYKSTALQPGRDFNLEDYTNRVAKRWPSEEHSIQIIGPHGHGKFTLLRFAVQDIIRRMPNSLLLKIILEPFEMGGLSLRTIARSFVHQIISQKPAFFSHIRDLYLQHQQSNGTTRQNTLWAFLRILLRASRGWRIVVAANNVHLWPSPVQTALNTLEEFLKSLGSEFLFVSSSNNELSDLCVDSRQVIDLGLSDSNRDSIIHARVRKVLFEHPAFQTSAAQGYFRVMTMPQLLSPAQADRYAKVLSRSLLLASPLSVYSTLKNCPTTGQEIFQDSINALHQDLLSWSCSTISWVQRTVRPLRTRELAVAVALDEGFAGLSDLMQHVSSSIENDITRHLDVVLRVDNDLVSFYSANTRRFLAEKRSELHKMRGLSFFTDDKLVRLCLHSISVVISTVPEEISLAHVIWRERIRDHASGIQHLNSSTTLLGTGLTIIVLTCD